MAEYQLYEFASYRYVGKIRCPSCGGKKCFTPYVFKGTTKIVRPDLGRCDHESSCGCHNKPWELPKDEQKALRKEGGIADDYVPPPPPPPKPLQPIPGEYVKQMQIVYDDGKGLKIRQSNLTDYMRDLPFMPLEQYVEALIRYYVGITRERDVIFWQIDCDHLVHGGKIMRYLPNGHRDKSDGKGKVSWVHSKLIYKGLLPKDYELQQCLFGLHLLNRKENEGKSIAIVESEKSAVFCSIFHPQFIWMACGGLSNLTPEKLKPIIDQRRRIYLFPDIDGWDKWKAKCNEISQTYFDICIHSWIKKHYDSEKDAENADILDITLREFSDEYEGINLGIPITEALRLLINKFDLVPC